MIPGEIITAGGSITLNTGKETHTIAVANTGDRPIQVGSHYHFFEVNRLLSFDRDAAFGFRLDIASGTSVRFEPGETRTVALVKMCGTHGYYGLNNLTAGGEKPQAMMNAVQNGFIK